MKQSVCCGLVSCSVYHTQTNVLVEQRDKTPQFSRMNAFGITGHALLLALWELHQASTGLSPFELLYGRKPRRCLKKTGRKVQAHLRNKLNKFWTKATHSGEVVIGECPPDPGTGPQQRG